MINAIYAQAAAPGAMDYMNSLLVPTVIIIGIMYFLMIRPQQQRMKQHKAMLEALRRGDQVVTGGGIVGKVVKVDENELQLEIADGVRIRVLRSSISEVRGKGEPAASSSGKGGDKGNGKSSGGKQANAASSSESEDS